MENTSNGLDWLFRLQKLKNKLVVFRPKYNRKHIIHTLYIYIYILSCNHYYKNTLLRWLKSQFAIGFWVVGYRPNRKGIYTYHLLIIDCVNHNAIDNALSARRCWLSNAISFVLHPMANVVNAVSWILIADCKSALHHLFCLS